MFLKPSHRLVTRIPKDEGRDQDSSAFLCFVTITICNDRS
nr:MAG TPA: hypothetical protein [Caudoviricetes sp.]